MTEKDTRATSDERPNRSTADDSDASEPVRPRTPQERAGVDPSQVEEPPKAEGDRDEAED